MFVSVTRGIFVLCHRIIVNLFVRKPELNGAKFAKFRFESRPPRLIRDSSLVRDESLMNLGGRDLNSCHFCPSFFCPPTVQKIRFF
jgi:hypothetical protein